MSATDVWVMFTDDEIEGLKGLWLSRLMFGRMTGIPEMVEDRSFEEFLHAYAAYDELDVPPAGDKP